MTPRELRTSILLFLPALFIAFVIWLIAKQDDLASDSVWVPVQLEGEPPNMAVQADPAEVEVRVQFPRDQAYRISARNFSLVINVADRFLPAEKWTTPEIPTEAPYLVNPKRDVRTPQLPPTIQVAEVIPYNIILRGRLRTQRPRVHVVLDGQLPLSLQFTDNQAPKPDPEQILVTGSAEALRNLTEGLGNQIDTMPIDLSSIRGYAQVWRDLVLPDGVALLDPKTPSIPIYIGVTERSTTRTLDQVPIRIVSYTAGLTARVTPPTMRIVLSGPPSKLDTISADQFVFTPVRPLTEEIDRSQDVGITPRLSSSVPSDTALKVEIQQWDPPRVTIQFVRDVELISSFMFHVPSFMLRTPNFKSQATPLQSQHEF
jgi:hypothetical protein